MSYKDTVLSLSPDGEKLLRYEASLREAGYEVILASTPLGARFEIEMGRCGVFMTSYMTPMPIYRDLAQLFRASCPGGLVVFLRRADIDDIQGADFLISEKDRPNLVVDWLRKNSARLGALRDEAEAS